MLQIQVILLQGLKVQAMFTIYKQVISAISKNIHRIYIS